MNQVPNISDELQADGDCTALEAQKTHVLARLRAYGPAFDQELEYECGVPVPDPASVVVELQADGYCIETLRCYREVYPGGPRQWANLRVMRVRLEDTGEVVATPVQPGMGHGVELWQAAAALDVGGGR